MSLRRLIAFLRSEAENALRDRCMLNSAREFSELALTDPRVLAPEEDRHIAGLQSIGAFRFTRPIPHTHARAREGHAANLSKTISPARG